MAVELVVSGSTFEAGKDYIAAITGTDAKFGLAREFCAAPKVGSKSGRTWTRTYRATVSGLYELSSTGKKAAERAYCAVVPGPDGALVRVVIALTTLEEILASGRPVTDLRPVPSVSSPGRYTIRRADQSIRWA